jgi:small GTP-binding protein
MVEYEERIKELEEELRKTPYNKKTQHHIGLVKAKIAMLKDKQLKRSSGGKKGEGYSVKKSGDATVILVGFPSVGKSTLLNKLTSANSPIGTYAFTTLTVVPGVLEHEHAKIQVLDVPGVVHGAATGKGRGKEVLAVMRSANLAVIIIDVNFPGHLKVLQKEIYDAGLRLNAVPPIVKIKKKPKGGLDIGTTVKLTKIKKETIAAILKEFRINNAEIVIRTNITPEQLIDAIEANKVYVPSIIMLNKIDTVSEKKLEQVKQKIKPDICVSGEKDINIEELKDMIFKKLNFIRIFCKHIGKKPDLNVPLIMKKGTRIKDMCEKLHRDFITKFKFARVWGKSAKFPGQRLMLNHKLKDKDIVELHMS